MICPDCTTSAEKPWHQFRAGCKGCEARALSRSPEYVESLRSGKLTPRYRAALALTGLSHESVKLAAKEDAIR